jgi:hypothetical protein
VHIWQQENSKLKLAMILAVTAFLALAVAAKAEEACGKLGELGSFHVMANDLLALVAIRDFSSAENRMVEFETAWAIAESDLRQRDEVQWSAINNAVSSAISALQRSRPDQSSASRAVKALVETLKRPCLK